MSAEGPPRRPGSRTPHDHRARGRSGARGSPGTGGSTPATGRVREIHLTELGRQAIIHAMKVLLEVFGSLSDRQCGSSRAPLGVVNQRLGAMSDSSEPCTPDALATSRIAGQA